jgi:cation:H+ antiporter
VKVIVDIVIFLVAMGALIKGADFVIDEAEKIALHFGIPSFIIGATVVALGTSLPEMVASIIASYKHHSQLAVSNVIGSNIINLALVLGLVFIIGKKLTPKRDIFKEDSAWALFPILSFLLIAYDGVVSRFEGVIYLAMMGAYLVFLKNNAMDMLEIDDDVEKKKFDTLKTVGLLAVGFILVIVGANFAVDSASNIARVFGVSEWIIGLLLVAFGTSLPELVVSLQAVKKGDGDMAIGNVIGSNIANFTVVIGASALVNPLTVNLQNSMFDIFAALILTIMLVFVAVNKLYNRSTGMVFLLVLLLVLEHSLG